MFWTIAHILTNWKRGNKGFIIINKVTPCLSIQIISMSNWFQAITSVINSMILKVYDINDCSYPFCCTRFGWYQFHMIRILFIRFQSHFMRFSTPFVKIWNRRLKSRLTRFYVISYDCILDFERSGLMILLVNGPSPNCLAVVTNMIAPAQANLTE